jgi:hypothetical protein
LEITAWHRIAFGLMGPFCMKFDRMFEQPGDVKFTRGWYVDADLRYAWPATMDCTTDEALNLTIVAEFP